MKFCQFTAWRQAVLVVESIPNSVSTLHCQAGQTMLNFSCLFLSSFGNNAMLNYFWDCVVTWMLTLGGTCHSSTPLHKNIGSGQGESRMIQAQAVQLDMCLGQFYLRRKWTLKCSSDWANDMDGDSAHSWNNEQYYNPDLIKRSTNYIEKVWVITVSEILLRNPSNTT